MSARFTHRLTLDDRAGKQVQTWLQDGCGVYIDDCGGSVLANRDDLAAHLNPRCGRDFDIEPGDRILVTETFLFIALRQMWDGVTSIRRI